MNSEELRKLSKIAVLGYVRIGCLPYHCVGQLKRAVVNVIHFWVPLPEF